DGPSIQLVSEARPTNDFITFANGVGDGITQYRLKAIVVRVSGVLRRAFSLAYAASEKTQMSKLSSVREYGRDAVVAADGTITGSSLVRFSAEYTAELGDTFTAKPDFSWCAGGTFVAVEHNGDGKADALCRAGPTATGG